MLISLSISKIGAAIILFLLAIISGSLPTRFAKFHSHMLHKGDAFARGVFLSAALLHMLPDAEASFQQTLPNLHYPIATFIVVLAFLFLFFVETSVNFIVKTPGKFKLELSTPYLLAILIMVHSVIEGAAIGINSTLADTTIIFFAVLAHKGFASFALSSNLNSYKLPVAQIKKIMLLFALMTPFGIFAATLVNYVLVNSFGLLVEAIFNAFAAGTFLYLGAVHSVTEPETVDCHQELWAMALGALLMAIVAIWV